MNIIKRCIRFTVEKNFLYLASALFVLIGSFQFMADADGAGLGEFPSTLALIIILQVYELTLAGVCYSVYKKMNIEHDGLMLGIISLLLIFDPTFFNNRLYTMAPSLWSGLAVNGILLILGLLKLRMLIHYTKIPLSKRYERCLQFIMSAIYLGPFLFHYVSYVNKVKLLSTAMVAIPVIPLLLPRPRKNPDKESPENLHFRFERYLFFLATLIIPIHLYELSIIYDLPWHMGSYVNRGLRTLPFTATILAPLIITTGLMIMKTFGSKGLNGNFHKWMAIGSVAAAACSELVFSQYPATADIITHDVINLLTVSVYMIITWSVTGDEKHIWHAQIPLILIFGGTNSESMARSIIELNPLILTAFTANICLWSVFRGTEDDHRNSLAAGTILFGRGFYEIKGFTVLYNAADYLFTGLGNILEYVFSLISHILSIIYDIIAATIRFFTSGARNHTGVLSLLGAFGLLLGGFYISAHKDSLMSEMNES